MDRAKSNKIQCKCIRTNDFIGNILLNENICFISSNSFIIIKKINMKTQEAAKYVENLIPKKDLNALFLFEDSGDMDFFLGELRNKRRLVVHAALVPRDSVDTYRPSYDIRDLKYFPTKKLI